MSNVIPFRPRVLPVMADAETAIIRYRDYSWGEEFTAQAIKVDHSEFPCLRPPRPGAAHYIALHPEGYICLVQAEENNIVCSPAQVPPELDFCRVPFCPMRANHVDDALARTTSEFFAYAQNIDASSFDLRSSNEKFRPIAETASFDAPEYAAICYGVAKAYYDDGMRLQSIRDNLKQGYGPRVLGRMIRDLWRWAWPELALVAPDIRASYLQCREEVMCRARHVMTGDELEMIQIEAQK
jgi:hypothetical protein